MDYRTVFGVLRPLFDVICFETTSHGCAWVFNDIDNVDNHPHFSGILQIVSVNLDPDGKVQVIPYKRVVFLDRDWRVAGSSYNRFESNKLESFVDMPKFAKDFQDGQVAAVLFCLSMLNCRRQTELIERPDLNPPDKWLRRQKQPKLRYHTLNIDPLKKMLKYDSAADPTGRELAWHLCRGHWKHYTAEKPLFGSYVGSVWCPPHAKGKKENGVVLKEYAIKATTNE